MKRISALLLMILACAGVSAQELVKPVTINVDLNKRSAKPLTPIWRFFGYDEANYTYMKDGKKLLTELSALSQVPVFVRAHNLLTSGNGIPALKWSSTNAYTEDAHGRPVYNWKLTDSIFDVYMKRGMKPLVEVGFMPEAMSTTPESDKFQTTPDGKKVYHYTGWSYPPKDYKKYDDLVYEWVKHCIARYGKKEVESWYWEIWNEPDISYWKGTVEEFLKLYDYATDGVKRALPTAKVGGPETTNPGSAKAGAFLKSFLDHVATGNNAVTGKHGVPLDFITFHSKGDARLINGTPWMNIGVQMRNIERGFDIISAYPGLKNLPIIIGESDPEGCSACSVDVYPQNAYRNNTVYPTYTAVSIATEYDLAEAHHMNLFGAVTWAFEFEDQPWFRGFRDLATNGVDKPIVNVFRMFGMMKGTRVPVESNGAYTYKMIVDSSIRKHQPDVNGFSTSDGRAVYVMVWNYHDNYQGSFPASPVSLNVEGLKSQSVTVTHYRIDQDHSNAYTVWTKMNSPQQPTDEQYKQLEAAGQLQTLGPKKTDKVVKGKLSLLLEMPQQSVSLLKIEPVR